MLLFEVPRGFRVLSFLIGQPIKQFSCSRMRDAIRRPLVKPYRLHLHHSRVFSGCVHAQRTHQPQRLSMQESLYVFPSNQRNVIPKSFSKLIEQPVPVSNFLRAHFFEHIRGCGIAFPQRIRELPVNPSVFLFVLNGQRQDFALRQILELFLHPRSVLCVFLTESNPEESHIGRAESLEPEFPLHYAPISRDAAGVPYSASTSVTHEAQTFFPAIRYFSSIGTMHVAAYTSFSKSCRVKGRSPMATQDMMMKTTGNAAPRNASQAERR